MDKTINLTELLRLPEDMRCLILGELSISLEELTGVSERYYPCVQRIVLEDDVLARQLANFRNLHSVSGRVIIGGDLPSVDYDRPIYQEGRTLSLDAGILIENEEDLVLLPRLTNYTTLFPNNWILIQFLSNVPPRHFLRGRKLFATPEYHFSITDGHLDPTPRQASVDFEDLFEVLVARQLFTGLTIREAFASRFHTLIAKIRRITDLILSPQTDDGTIFDLRGIYGLSTLRSIAIDVSDVAPNDPQLLKIGVRITNFLRRLKGEYGSLPSVTSFIAPLTIIQIGTALSIFPNLREVGLFANGYSDEELQTYVKGWFRLGRIQKIVIYHQGDLYYPDDDRVDLVELPGPLMIDGEEVLIM